MAPPLHLSPPIAAALGDIRTARLDLRRFVAADLSELAAVFAHPEVWEFPYGRGFTIEQTELFLTQQIREWADFRFGRWVARLSSDNHLIGYIGLSVPIFLPDILPAVEIGWRLEPTSWGKGYATEGAIAALDAAFTTLRLEQVCAIIEHKNRRSVQVAVRLGMQFVREVVIPANERRGELKALLYEIRGDEWLARHALNC